MTTNSNIYLTILHGLLNQHFSLAEIQTLCFNLNVDYESVPGEEKPSRIRELLLDLGRNGRLPELITLAEQYRPDIPWPPVLDDFQLPESLASGDAIPPGQHHIYGDVVQGDKISVGNIEWSVAAVGAGAVAVASGGVYIAGSVNINIVIRSSKPVPQVENKHTKITIFIMPCVHDDDAAFIECLYNDLNHHQSASGERVFDVRRDIEIEQAERLVLVWSNIQTQPAFIKNQWQYAQSICKTVHVVLHQGDFADVPEELKKNVLDFRDDAQYDDHLRQFCEQLKQPEAPIGELWGVRDVSQFVPRVESLQRLREQILALQQSLHMGKIPWVGLRGMPGVGKSSLAYALARDCQVRRAFPDGVILVNMGRVSPNKDYGQFLIQRQAELIEHLGGKGLRDRDLQSRISYISRLLRDKKCLIILDDVWEVAQIQDAFLHILGPHSCGLFTTRTAQIAKKFRFSEVVLEKMSLAQSVELLEKWTGRADPAFVPIAQKLDGLPLALKLVGSMMNNTEIDGQTWLKDFKGVSDLNLGLHSEKPDESLTHFFDECLKAVSDETERYLYRCLSIFPEDYSIPFNTVTRFWEHIRPGIDGSKLIAYFADLSLIEVEHTNNTLQLHDLLRDYIREKNSEQVVSLHHSFLDAYNPQHLPWGDINDDGYLFDHLLDHLIQAERIDEIHELFATAYWSNARSLQGLLQDLEKAKEHTRATDYNIRIRYALFEEALQNQYPELPVEIAVELIRRDLVLSPEMLISSIRGMEGDNTAKVDAYINAIQRINEDHLRERFAIDAIEIATRINDKVQAIQRALTIKELFQYLSPFARQGRYRLYWNAILEIGDFDVRLSLLDETLPLLSPDQKLELTDDLLRLKANLRKIVVFERIQHIYEEKARTETWETILNAVMEDEGGTWRAYLLANLIECLPQTLKQRTRKDIWETLNSCRYWEMGTEWWDEDFFGNIFDPLVRWLEVEDVAPLWERAKKEYERDEYWPTVAIWSILKCWATASELSEKFPTLHHDMAQLIHTHVPTGVGSGVYCKLMPKLIPALPEDKQEEAWHKVFQTAVQADDFFFIQKKGDTRPEEDQKQQWLDEFLSLLPSTLIPALWQETIRIFNELSQKDSPWPHPKRFALAIPCLANHIPNDLIDEHIESAIEFWQKRVDYTPAFNYPDIWIKALTCLIDRIDQEQHKNHWWDKLVEIAFSKQGEKLRGFSLFDVVGQSTNEKWREQRFEQLSSIVCTRFEHPWHSLLSNFSQIPENLRPGIWLEAVSNIEADYGNPYILSCLPEVYPKIQDHFPDTFQGMDWDFQRWERTLRDSIGIGAGMYGNTRGGLCLLLQNAPAPFKSQVWQKYKSNIRQEDWYTSRPAVEVIILLFEHMSEQEKEKALAGLISSGWEDKQVAGLTPLLVKSWQGATIWSVWQYMHQMDPEKDYAYSNWALALAHHIPEEHISQAYTKAFQHVHPQSWPKWGAICETLALSLPGDFADTEWQRIESIKRGIKKSGPSGGLASLDEIQKALVISLSDEKLYSLMDKYRQRARAVYRQITNPNLFAGNLLQHLRSIFSLVKSSRAANTWWYDKITNIQREE